MIINKNIALPPNQKFGYFFTLVFLITSIYSYFRENNMVFYVLGACSIVFFIVTLLKAEILKPLNKLWMGFGLVLGMIVSPMVMGVIFFMIFTPIGILMRLFGRDELLLQFKAKSSYWIKRHEDIHSNSFRRQF
tara:strand:- start:1443 stop:1844 length:402 start_codon:yes stop_codon:yes gene_type:complete